ncbi:MAG: GcvT family protein [Alphaproteobacteria bacterium]
MSNKHAKHLIIGGGIIGCSIAYHLAERGEQDIILLEKSALTEGATWHAAGLVGQLRSSRNTTRMLQRSVALYDRIEAETGQSVDWKKTGSLRLAASKERMLEIHRLAAMAASFGLEMTVISPAEAKALFPLIDADGLEGAAFIPTDGHVDPASLCQAIAAGARQMGVTIVQGVKVLDFATDGPNVSEVHTDDGIWSAETVTIAAGMWSRELGKKLGINIPACAVEHQYVVTEPIPDCPENLPTLRDPDRLVYYKPDAGGRLVIGGYEDDTVPFGVRGVPGDFSRQLLPDNLERFAPLAENAAAVTPIVGEIGIRTVINGPIPYSADGDFVMGRPPGFDNLMVASGFLYGIAAGGGAGEAIAQWILDGRPALDLWPLDIRRFGPHHNSASFLSARPVEHYEHHYKMRFTGAEHATIRGIRRSPLYETLKSRGAVYGSKNGWERPLWFAPDGVEPVDTPAFVDPPYEEFVATEHRAVREKVALIDQSSFSKFELSGPGALEALQRLAVSNMDKPVGAVIYTQLCNPTGGIEADLTITRLGEDHFYVVTGSGFGVHDADWIGRHLPDDGSAQLTEVTSARGVLNLCGPKAREVLSAVAEEDVSNAAFPFATMQNLTLGAATVRAIRIGYCGELGWELHIPAEYTAHVYETLREAGEEMGIADVGCRAIETLRLEKGYLYWSADITPDYTPVEAGLAGRVHLKSKGDFIGRPVLEVQKSEGSDRRLCTFVSDKKLPLAGGEPILLDGKVVSLATSAGYGHFVGQSILFGYLDNDLAGAEKFQVEAFGARHDVSRVDGPLYDRASERLRS